MEEQEDVRPEPNGTLFAGGSGSISGTRPSRLEEDCARPSRLEEDCARPMREDEVPNSKTMREIGIKQLNYGYNVIIGCHTFAIETPEKLIEKLAEYIKDPKGTEKKWFTGQLF